mgnify:CR=1 FL=1
MPVALQPYCLRKLFTPILNPASHTVVPINRLVLSATLNDDVRWRFISDNLAQLTDPPRHGAMGR